MTDEMDEVWALYADDGSQALDAAETALDALEGGAAPDDHVGALFRAVHTFKGNARVLGLANVESLAHLAEDLIGLVRDEGVALSPEIVKPLIRSVDEMRAMLEETADTRADVDAGQSADLKDALRALIGRLTGADASAPPADTPPAADQPAPGPDPDAPATLQEAPGTSDDHPVETDPGTADPDASKSDPDPAASETIAPPEAPANTDAPAASKPPALDPALAGLLDQLDGGDHSDFDPFEDDEADGPAVDESAPLDPAPLDCDPQEAPDPSEAEPAETLAELAEGKPQGGLIDIDPMYRQIFTDMARKTLAALDEARDAATRDRARGEVEGLAYAASQMSLPEWVAPLEAFPPEPSEQDARDMAVTLRALLDRDFGTDAPEAPPMSEDTAQAADPTPDAPVTHAPPETSAPDPIPDEPVAQAPADSPAPVPAEAIEDADDRDATGAAFFAAISEVYPVVADFGLRMGTDTPPTAQERQAMAERIVDLADPAGYVRVCDAARALATATPDGYRAAQLDFYQELVNVERSLPASVFQAGQAPPSAILGAWCADTVFEALHALRQGLDGRDKASGAAWFPAFEGLMRQVHFACQSFHVESAAHLTMALIDLFARTRTDAKGPDVILLQMGRGFVDTMELVFDALAQGDTPDVSRIEQLFEETANACFLASGVVTAKTIEARLGLPPEFHRVLSPESVKSAHDAIEDGLRFYVLRADLNDDDALAQSFLDWITTDRVRMITNVTVFRDDRTLFDFLVASTLSEDAMTERLALLDVAGSRLHVLEALRVRDMPDDGAGPAQDAAEASAGPDRGDTLALLETVGAISASHAQLDRELTQLASVDLVKDVLGALRDAGLDELGPEARAILAGRLERHHERLRHISEAGTLLASELSTLREESVAQRSRPAEVFLRPLRAYAVTRARALDGSAQLSYVGADIVLDQALIEELRDLTKTLITLRLEAARPATRFHVALEMAGDQVLVEITDDSPEPVADARVQDMDADLRRRGGALRHAPLPGGAGLRFRLSVPQRMVVLDGMVVRVGDMRYVLPIDAIQRILQTDRLLPVAAAGDARMLNIGEEGLVPVHALPTTAGADMAPRPAPARLFVVISDKERKVALPVDEVLGQQLVLLRPLQGVLSSIRHMSGIALLSGGDVGMVVAVGGLMRASGPQMAA